MVETLLTPVGFLYAPNLFEAKGNPQNPAQEARFSTLLVFDANATQTTAYQTLRQGVKEAIAEKFGDSKAMDESFVRALKLPFRLASDKGYLDWANAEVFINAWKKGSNPPPGVVDLHDNKIQVPSDVWGGQLARMTVRPFAYDSNGNKGVSFGLEHVQIVKADMPARAGSQTTDQAFGGKDLDPAQATALGIGGTGNSGPASGSADDGFPF